MIDSSYVVCGQHYKNKLAAYHAALPQGYWPHWNFYESVFEKFDWKQEPWEDLSQLYRDRAQDIRNRYDNVIVWLSGGADSDNVVRSFLTYNIHIDEIWHRNTHRHHNRSDAGVDQENHCSELKLAFEPRIKEYLQQYSNMKARLHTFDVMDIAIPYWEQGQRNPYEISTYTALLPVKEHKEMCATHGHQGSVCHIYGIDKPIVLLDGGQWTLEFQDSMVNAHNVDAKTSDYQEEFFYWHPNSLKILAKQAHVIRRWFLRHPHLLWVVKERSQRAKIIYNEVVKNIIYPWWNNQNWQPNKYDSEIDWPEIFWFYQNPTNVAVQNWRNTALALKAEILDIYNNVAPSQHNYKEVRGYLNLPINYSKAYSLY